MSFLFKPFQNLEFNLQNNYDSWKYVYMEQKNEDFLKYKI